VAPSEAKPAAPRPLAPAASPAAEAPRPSSPAPREEEAVEPPAVAPGTDPRIVVFLEAVSKRRPPLAARLGRAAAVGLADGELCIYAAASDADLRDALRRHATTLDEAAREALGEAAVWRLIANGEAPPAGATRPEPPSAPAPRAAAPAAVAHPTVQTMLEIFGGSARADTSPTEEG
jgi:hypothetical protein